MITALRTVAAFLAMGAIQFAWAAQPMLDGPLRVIVPYGPGGGMDGIMRPLAGPLSKALGVSIVIDNRPGGSTKIGTLATEHAQPDGHTVMLMPAPAWIGFFYEGLFDFKPWETMTPIAQVAESPYSVIVAKAGGPYQTWQDVVRKAKAADKPIMASAPAAGGFTEMALHEVARDSGIEAIQVPYASASPARLALLSGDVDIQMDSMAALSGLTGRQTKGLAISTASRMPQAPDIPTFSELGLSARLPTNAFSFWGPAGMQPEMVAHLAQAVREAIQDPAFVQTLESQNLIRIRFKSGEEIAKELKQVERDWGPKLAAALKQRMAKQ